MNKFDNRSTELELMDGEIENKSELFLNLRELEFINTLTGGPALVFSGPAVFSILQCLSYSSRQTRRDLGPAHKVAGSVTPNAPSCL